MIVPESFARFQHEDADQIDSEDDLSTEYFNDELSYRAPFFWERWWKSRRIGGRFNAGSYNKTRLMFLQEVKLASSDEKLATLAYRQKQDENLLVKSDQREFEIRLNQVRPIFVSLLADTDRDKEYGDGGVALALMPRKNRLFKIYGWSVDHFYNEKKEVDDDRYKNMIYTYGMSYDWAFSRDWSLSYAFELDTPLEWQRLSESYVYGYKKNVHRLSTDWGQSNSGLLLRFSATLENKSESKSWLDLASGSENELGFKSLERKVQNYEILGNYAFDSRTDLTACALLIHRDAKYVWRGEPSKDEQESPDSTRNEIAAYVTYMKPFTMSQGLQYGLFMNEVDLEEAIEDAMKITRKTEVKFQFGWNYTFDPQVATFVNSTWDLDQLWDDFPYHKKTFKPWGGGNIQFIAVF